jgi:hypothetical protein
MPWAETTEGTRKIACSPICWIALPPFGYERIDGMLEILRMIVSLAAWVVLALVFGVAIGGLLAVLAG